MKMTANQGRTKRRTKEPTPQNAWKNNDEEALPYDICPIYLRELCKRGARENRHRRCAYDYGVKNETLSVKQTALDNERGDGNVIEILLWPARKKWPDSDKALVYSSHVQRHLL